MEHIAKRAAKYITEHVAKRVASITRVLPRFLSQCIRRLIDI